MKCPRDSRDGSKKDEAGNLTATANIKPSYQKVEGNASASPPSGKAKKTVIWTIDHLASYAVSVPVKLLFMHDAHAKNVVRQLIAREARLGGPRDEVGG